MNAASAWDGNWAWGLPLIAVTVIFHVIGLGLINVRAVELITLVKGRRRFVFIFALVLGVTTILATILIGAEAGIWAAAYRILGALPDNRSAMLYSLSAITTYGHAELFLLDRWKLLGALEALNGIMLLGLTTAFMYGIIQRVWPIEERDLRAPRIRWPKRKKGQEPS
jgi:MFS superfamily sulfate permease-like transporter